MFSDYKSRVIECYERKRDNGSLSLNLVHPTPANLRNECLLLLPSRSSRQDEATLRQFCGFSEDKKDLERALETFDVDKFRPLSRFLSAKTLNLQEKNIELLAWLIDFTPRPYQPGRDYSNVHDVFDDALGQETEMSDLDSFETNSIRGGSSIAGQARPRSYSRPWLEAMKSRKQLLIIITVIVCAGVFSLSPRIVNRFTMQSSLDGSQCMYWVGDHYKPIDCARKVPNTVVVALDTLELNHFRKVTRPDTLREEHISKVWYSKHENNVEFYTMSGRHPEDPGRQLRPMTKYMFEKYVMRAK